MRVKRYPVRATASGECLYMLAQCWLWISSYPQKGPQLKFIVTGFAGETHRGCAQPSSCGLDYAQLRVPFHGWQLWHSWGMSLHLVLLTGGLILTNGPVFSGPVTHALSEGAGHCSGHQPKRGGEEHFWGCPVPAGFFFFLWKGLNTVPHRATYFNNESFTK